MAMVPPSVPRTNRPLSEMVPGPGQKLPNLGSNDPIFRAASSPMRRFGAPIVSPFRPNGVTIRSQGTKAPVKTLVARDRRSPLTTWRMSRIAKGSLLQGPLFSKTSARADSQKRRSPVPFRIASRARNRGRVGADAGAFLPERGFVMRNRIDIDPKHSRAIVQEIGERLRAFLKEEPELPGSLRTQIDRLRELEEQSP